MNGDELALGVVLLILFLLAIIAIFTAHSINVCTKDE